MASATYHNKSGATPQSPQLAELKAIFDAGDDTALVARRQAYRPTGRPGYPLRALGRAYLASFCLNLGNANGRGYGWFLPAVALVNRGYAAAGNHQHLRRPGIAPVIHIRRPSNKTGLYQDIYTQDGVPPCLGIVPWSQRRPSGQRLAINHSSAAASSGNSRNSSVRPMPWR